MQIYSSNIVYIRTILLRNGKTQKLEYVVIIRFALSNHVFEYDLIS